MYVQKIFYKELLKNHRCKECYARPKTGGTGSYWYIITIRNRRMQKPSLTGDLRWVLCRCFTKLRQEIRKVEGNEHGFKDWND